VVFARLGLALGIIVFVIHNWLTVPPAGVKVARTPAAVAAIVQIAPKLYLVPGGGCNTAVFVAETGVVLVDTKYDASWPALLAQVRSVTDKPITHVVNTHFHGDHTGGNAWLPPDAEVWMHANAARRWHEVLARMGWPYGPARPVRTYTGRFTLLAGVDAIDLHEAQPSHTDGDTFVVFRQARVMHAGDVFPGLQAPIINLEGGGHGENYPAALAAAARDINNVDRIITGHGPVVEWRALGEYAGFVQAMVDYVEAEMRIGRDKARVFRAFVRPQTAASYNLDRQFETLDEIDRTLRPRWQRLF
jgi:glyoxylase-like metal-dependent hydrolase (beta-lactamase superfamily II)